MKRLGDTRTDQRRKAERPQAQVTLIVTSRSTAESKAVLSAQVWVLGGVEAQKEAASLDLP